MKNFKKLKVWENGFRITLDAYRLTRSFPNEERFGLVSQITNAAISIPSNIAEGSSRSSIKDYCRFLEISLGSSFELETHLLLSEALHFGNDMLRTEILNKVKQEHMMLHSLLQRLRSS